MRSGKLDRIINLERQNEFVAPSGDVSVTWTSIGNVRAELVQHVATEGPAGHGEAETGTVTFRIRYLPGITTGFRLVYQGQTYGITYIVEIGRRKAMEVTAKAIR